jgi:hypothetical protein
MKRLSFLVVLILVLTVTIPVQAQEAPELDVVKNQFILESAKIADMGMETAKNMLLSAFFENVTEADVVRAINNAMTDNGSSEYVEAFGVIVASGDQSAIPHGDETDDSTNQILPGEVVVVDLGARYRGYCSDLTRTFFMGNASQEMMHVYNITLEANEAAIEYVSAGVLARDVDKVARDIITSYGYGENFIHALGHGIGLYIHMPPTLSSSSNGVLFESGDMTVTIEPGIYLEGQFGVRIEDDVFVERTGYEVLTFFPKSLDDAILTPEEVTGEEPDLKMSEKDEAQIGDFFPTLLVIIIILAVVAGIVLLRRRRYSYPKIQNTPSEPIPETGHNR